MKTHLIIAAMFMLSCLLLAGCGDPDRAKLVGKWSIKHPTKVMKRIQQSNDESNHETNADSTENDASQKQAVDEAAELAPQPPKMQIQFLANATLQTITQMAGHPYSKQGSWKMLSFDQPTKSMKVQCKLGMQVTEHEIEFIDDDTIKLIPPNMAGLNLKLEYERQK